MPKPVTACHVNNNWAPIFVVQSVGVRSGQESTGFFEGEPQPPDIDALMRKNRVCHALRDMLTLVGIQSL